jgi:hypothetical protein
VKASTAQRLMRRDRQNQIDSPCLRARSPDMVPIRELPYGPAATYCRITRPDRWQHPTTRQKAKIHLLLRGRPQDEPSSRSQWDAEEAANAIQRSVASTPT